MFRTTPSRKICAAVFYFKPSWRILHHIFIFALEQQKNTFTLLFNDISWEISQIDRLQTLTACWQSGVGQWHVRDIYLFLLQSIWGFFIEKWGGGVDVHLLGFVFSLESIPPHYFRKLII